MKFIKKPIPIDAVKCIKENEEEIISFLESGITEWAKVLDDSYNTIGFNIHSWEGVDPVYYDFNKNKNSGGKAYWIIKGLKGECYPCVADDIEDAPLGYQKFENN